MEADNPEVVTHENEVQLILHNRNTVEGIQRDLGILMEKLNGFVADNRNVYESEEETDVDDDDEKQDNIPEKALVISEDDVNSALYISDELNPPEINWQFVAPLFQKQLEDLAKLQNLNHMMHSVTKRIRDFTQDPEAPSTSIEESN